MSPSLTILIPDICEATQRPLLFYVYKGEAKARTKEQMTGSG